MRRLLLLRHAQAHPAPPGAGDVDRELTSNGRAEAVAAAGTIARTHLPIDRVLVSTARRALETAAIVAERLHLAQPPEPQETLYLAAPHSLLQALARLPASCHDVLLIGHNPGLSELAVRLAGGEQPVSLCTAGVCVLSLAGDGWRDVAADIAETCKVLR